MENWKLLDNYKFPYYVSDEGRVKNRFGKIMTPHHDKDGYLRLRLFRNNGIRYFYLIHRLVLMAFFPTEDKTLTVNHKDGNKKNNHLTDLEWMTRAENNQHAYNTGLKNNKGSNHGRANFTEEQVLEIRRLYDEGTYGQTILSRMFNTTQPRISEIIRRKTWNHI